MERNERNPLGMEKRGVQDNRVEGRMNDRNILRMGKKIIPLIEKE